MARGNPGNLPNEQRCTKTREVDGVRQRCKNARYGDTTLCRRHAPPNLRRSVARAKLRSIVDYSEVDDVELGAALREEIRRTHAAIFYCEQQLRELAPDVLVWGLAERRELMSGEYPGTDDIFKSGANQWLELWQRERKHLADLLKLGIAAGFQAESLRIEGEKLALFHRALQGILTRLNVDLSDETVRGVVVDELRALEAVQSV